MDTTITGIAGEELNYNGMVYVGTDGKLYNSPKPIVVPPFDYTANHCMGLPHWYIDRVNKSCGWMV